MTVFPPQRILAVEDFYEEIKERPSDAATANEMEKTGLTINSTYKRIEE